MFPLQLSRLRRELPRLCIILAHKPPNDQTADKDMDTHLGLLYAAAEEAMSANGGSAISSSNLIQHFKMDPLTRLDIERLVCATLHVDEAPNALLNYIAQRSRGSAGTALGLVRRLVMRKIIGRKASSEGSSKRGIEILRKLEEVPFVVHRRPVHVNAS